MERDRPTRVYYGGGGGAETCPTALRGRQREGEPMPRPRAPAHWCLEPPQEERPSQRVDDLPTTRFSTAASEACWHGRRARRARTGESKQRPRGTGQDDPASAQRCLPGPHGTHRDAEEQPRAPRPGPRGCSGKERRTPSLRPGMGRGAAATRDAGCAVRPAFRTSSGFFWYK